MTLNTTQFTDWEIEFDEQTLEIKSMKPNALTQEQIEEIGNEIAEITL